MGVLLGPSGSLESLLSGGAPPRRGELGIPCVAGARDRAPPGRLASLEGLRMLMASGQLTRPMRLQGAQGAACESQVPWDP